MKVQRILFSGASALVFIVGFSYWRASASGEASPATSFSISFQSVADGTGMASLAVGHEYRQDDLPSIATAPDGSIWVVWLSFIDNRDDVAIRHFKDDRWSNLQWVPGASGDCWLPQVATDNSNRLWVVWSQQIRGNWDIYARRFDPTRNEWSTLERLTSDPLPDLNPRVWSDANGRIALVWQGFRGKNSNIFLRTLDGEAWSEEVRVTNRAANDWDPAVAMDTKGNVWIAYDSYKNGDYDVFLSQVRGGRVQGPEIEVASTARFEARATVAVDRADRVWVAWEEGLPNWGKDRGYVLGEQQNGAPLGGSREARIRCFQSGIWREPETPLSAVFKSGDTYQPQVLSDGQGSIWVAAKIRKAVADTLPVNIVWKNAARNYWEYEIAQFLGDRWSEKFIVPSSKGRISTRINAAPGRDGDLWLAWPTDNRSEKYYQRPLRQQVFAGVLSGRSAGVDPVWKKPVQEKAAMKPADGDEAADVRALRSYTTTIDGRPHRILRGDLHRHTELSWDAGGPPDGSLQDFYRYMIDVASMDFGASTDHQGGAWPYWWWYTQKMADMYHVAGAFVPFFGYERSGKTPLGHRNVIFAKRSEARVTPFFLRDGVQEFGLPLTAFGDSPVGGTDTFPPETQVDPWNDTQLVYEDIRGLDVIAIPHTSCNSIMGTDWRDYDPELEPVVEIFQGLRTSCEDLGAPFVVEAQWGKILPEGMVSNAWAKGYRLGVIASSDHFSTYISYAMVYTDDPTREGILKAIRKRHTYGAMDNILLDVRMGKHFMGDEFDLAKAQALRVVARGTKPVKKVDIIRDSETIYSSEPGQQNVAFDFLDKSPTKGRHYYYVRLQQSDGMIAWSSPVFVNYR